ncbi:uncharacterized protein MELLADRAFT_95956 [Melampsora larici-populina 98AG31]|uniref:GCM domain-containing protein n=1 Tax=Melampsora larici-populina (strain 98AG31 / pathotype 3-4-7) TaxID=747676 RepID=F4RDW1_MELLP|nr:uncharacterized protein MELLADRAFT_95956 [Melampsora larici-populina 98AG31]EGG09474.1 hypothetical protein MELLADRAFT_95956 [Melampsora larici-populina 98AG31]
MDIPLSSFKGLYSSEDRALMLSDLSHWFPISSLSPQSTLLNEALTSKFHNRMGQQGSHPAGVYPDDEDPFEMHSVPSTMTSCPSDSKDERSLIPNRRTQDLDYIESKDILITRVANHLLQLSPTKSSVSDLITMTDTERSSTETPESPKLKKSKKKKHQQKTTESPSQHTRSKHERDRTRKHQHQANADTDTEIPPRSKKQKTKKNKAKKAKKTHVSESDHRSQSDCGSANPGQSQLQLQLPTNISSFTDFIDHGCELDEQMYPVYPNGNTVFVKAPNRPVTNFGFIGWTHTMKTDNSHKDWKILRFKCLGVILCSVSTCPLTGSPPTGRHMISELIERGCDGIQVHIPCNGRCRIDEHKPSNWRLLRHQGQHDHVWPSAKKAPPLAKQKLKEIIINDPTTGPLSLKVGRAHVGTAPIRTVSDIHPSFDHVDRLGNLRRAFLVQEGLMPDSQDKEAGDKWLMQFIYWSTNWMAQILVNEEDGIAYEGGLLSDVTYRFFENGYLLTTSMYLEKLERWVPILLSWINGLSQHHYKAHFKTLFVQIEQTSMSDEQKSRLTEQIVDFSLAQKSGFIEAYMDVFNVSREVALSKLHGCEQHFGQAITRLRKNRSIVPWQDEKSWVAKCNALMEPDSPGNTLDDKFVVLSRAFPRAKRWLDWWRTSDIQAMLFPARKRMPLDDPPLDNETGEETGDVSRKRKKRGRDDGLPSTTNGQESMHRIYYLLCPGKCNIIGGIIQLLAFVQSLERDHQNLNRGISVAYGSSQKNWEGLVKGMQMSKPTKQKFIANDGRPPDTTDELLGNVSKKSKRGPGRPKGSQNVMRQPLTTYQSYKKGTKQGSRNRCWQSSTLECLYTLFGPLWSRHATVNGTQVIHIIYTHFTKRSTLQLQGKPILGHLSTYQNLIHTALQGLGTFPVDGFASADAVMEILLRPGRNSIGPMFELPILKTSRCTANINHSSSTLTSRAILQVFPYTFTEAGLSYAQLGLLLERWVSEGLSSSDCVCQRCHPDEEGDSVGDDVVVCEPRRNNVEGCAMIKETIKIHLVDIKSAPIHLYFTLEGVMNMPEGDERDAYQGETNWPARIKIGEVDYYMMTRGFWGAFHFWCKVVRSVEGVLGVWHYDEAENQGIARLLDRDMTSIGGCQPHTSWCLMKEFPQHHHSIPFSMLLPDFPVGGGLPSAEVIAQDLTVATVVSATSNPIDLAEDDQAWDKLASLPDNECLEELLIPKSPIIPPTNPLKIKVRMAAHSSQPPVPIELPNHLAVTTEENLIPVKRNPRRSKKPVQDDIPVIPETVKPVKGVRKRVPKR